MAFYRVQPGSASDLDAVADRNEFYHEHFHRNEPEQMRRIVRGRSPGRRAAAERSSASNGGAIGTSSGEAGSPNTQTRSRRRRVSVDSLTHEAQVPLPLSWLTRLTGSVSLQVALLAERQAAMELTLRTVLNDLAALKGNLAMLTAAPLKLGAVVAATQAQPADVAALPKQVAAGGGLESPASARESGTSSSDEKDEQGSNLEELWLQYEADQRNQDRPKRPKVDAETPAAVDIEKKGVDNE